MRGMFSLVSLLIIGVGAAYYFTAAQPEISQPGQYEKLESKAHATAALMAHDPQADVDAATSPAVAPATNAPAGN